MIVVARYGIVFFRDWQQLYQGTQNMKRVAFELYIMRSLLSGFNSIISSSPVRSSEHFDICILWFQALDLHFFLCVRFQGGGGGDE